MARLSLAVAFAGAAVLIGAAQQQSPQQPPGGPPANFGDNFTGGITVIDSTDVRVSRIRFEAEARTNWHVHSAPQVLVAEQGRGRMQEQGGDIKDIVPGQPAFLKANVPHWHGADPYQPIVQLSMYAGSLKWLQPVSDEEYSGKKTGGAR